MKTLFKKSLAAAAVAGLALVGLTAPMAQAVDNGIINIHKYTKTADNGSTEANKAPTGTTADQANIGTGQPVEGVQYTIYRVSDTGNLTTNAEFEIANQIQTAYQGNRAIQDVTALKYGTPEKNVALDTSFGTAGSKVTTTTSAGLATFDTLPRGLYFVKESSVANAKVNNKATTVIPGEPFFVTLPYGTNMTVEVYPKNQKQDAAVKTPDLSKLSTGIMTYTVKAAIPAKPSAGFTKFDMLDKPNSMLEIASFTLKKVTVATKSASGGASTGEVVVFDGSTAPVKATSSGAAAGDKLIVKTETDKNRVSFNTAGLAYLGQQADAGKNEITYVYEMTLTATAKANGGTVTNSAIVVPDPNASEDIDGSTAKGSDETKLIAVKVFKSEADGTTALAGASLNIYRCSAAGDNQIADNADQASTLYTKADGTGTKKRNEAQKMNSATLNSVVSGTATTGNTGAPVLVKEGENYCVQEASAPTGYMLLAQDVKFTAAKDSSGGTVMPVVVKNYKSNFGGFTLPKTGSSAIILLTLAGVALVSGGLIMRYRNAKKKQATI